MLYFSKNSYAMLKQSSLIGRWKSRDRFEPIRVLYFSKNSYAMPKQSTLIGRWKSLDKFEPIRVLYFSKHNYAMLKFVYYICSTEMDRAESNVKNKTEKFVSQKSESNFFTGKMS